MILVALLITVCDMSFYTRGPKDLKHILCSCQTSSRRRVKGVLIDKERKELFLLRCTWIGDKKRPWRPWCGIIVEPEREDEVGESKIGFMW